MPPRSNLTRNVPSSSAHYCLWCTGPQVPGLHRGKFVVSAHQLKPQAPSPANSMLSCFRPVCGREKGIHEARRCAVRHTPPAPADARLLPHRLPRAASASSPPVRLGPIIAPVALVLTCARLACADHPLVSAVRLNASSLELARPLCPARAHPLPFHGADQRERGEAPVRLTRLKP